MTQYHQRALKKTALLSFGLGMMFQAFGFVLAGTHPAVLIPGAVLAVLGLTWRNVP